MADGPIDQLSRAFDAAAAVVAAVRDDQMGDPTPCPEWTVRDLMTHMTGGNRLFARGVRGDPAPPADRAVDVAPDATASACLMAFRASAADLLAAFAEPGALEKVVTVPFGSVPGIVALHLRITEMLVHGWDLARALGVPAELPADLAVQELAFTRAKLGDVPPGRSPFAPPKPVDPGAPAIDQLAACLGRTVGTP